MTEYSYQGEEAKLYKSMKSATHGEEDAQERSLVLLPLAFPLRTEQTC